MSWAQYNNTMMEEQNIKEAISLFVKITSHTFILFLNRRTLQRLFGTATLLASLLLCFIKSNKDAMNTSTPNRKQPRSCWPQRQPAPGKAVSIVTDRCPSATALTSLPPVSKAILPNGSSSFSQKKFHHYRPRVSRLYQNISESPMQLAVRTL